MKIKRYQLVIALLAAYAIFMTLYFGLDLLKEGQTVRFWLTLGGECLVLVLAFFAMRRRDALRNERNKDRKDF